MGKVDCGGTAWAALGEGGFLDCNGMEAFTLAHENESGHLGIHLLDSLS